VLLIFAVTPAALFGLISLVVVLTTRPGPPTGHADELTGSEPAIEPTGHAGTQAAAADKTDERHGGDGKPSDTVGH